MREQLVKGVLLEVVRRQAGHERRAGVQQLDQLEDALTGLALFRQRAAASAGTLPVLSRAPDTGSKKWKRRGSTARSIESPTRAAVWASSRAVKSARPSGSPSPVVASRI